MKGKGLDEVFIEICRAFNAHGVEYVVVGGFAIALHGLPRTAEDIDFFVSPAPENVEKIKSALKSIYSDPSIDEISSDDVSTYEVLRYGTPDNFYIDLIGNLGEVVTFEEVKGDTVFFEVNDVIVPVCGVKTLIKTKESMREKGLRDIEFLKKRLEKQEQSLDPEI